MLKEAKGIEERKKDDEISPEYRLPDKGFDFSLLEFTDAFASASLGRALSMLMLKIYTPCRE